MDNAMVTNHPTLLQVKEIHAYYGDSHVLQGCSLEVGNEVVTVLGRNGMGKTTLLRSIMGLTPPRAGEILWKGQVVGNKKPFQIAQLGIGYVPQGRKLFPSLSVEEHLRLTYRKANGSSEWTPERIFELFPELAERRKLSGAKLSGGEQQMLAIGRALVTNPELILLDRTLGRPRPSRHRTRHSDMSTARETHIACFLSSRASTWPRLSPIESISC